ncbi:hypothetical protein CHINAEXTREME_05540 [Halobiforma lacisalsi AJ5]|uniref:Uncharacterized protein n=1 Tax=Natronobacterium lacisalsi AJ5 TaxID=358396 RepID=M0LJG5_NATLA|nr:hypothetical protein [Halobiforma lacisalsi]APW97267.1 hypothetical protein CHINAEXTREME_05540 [Halobiforma lacisalsi AJ5]EMA33777.1 hypothetical protein C445_08814 [Halobiforma lacisalsi AJ5]
MMWQDLVFLIGSSLSVVFLAPTLRDSDACVPLGTSVPSMTIGYVYSLTFASLGMTFSATGSFTAGSMWALIALFRSPGAQSWMLTRREEMALFVLDTARWAKRRATGSDSLDQYEIDRPVYDQAAD